MMNSTKIKALQIFFLMALSIHNLYSQQSIGEGTSSPIASPSMASMASFADTPVNLVAGLPNINIPIVEVPMQDANVKLGFNLSYNPVLVDNIYRPASDVGAGWSLFGGSVIYKKVIGILDETYDDASKPNYKKNIFDDYYYYNLPGLSGKFQIKRDTINNTFSLVNQTPNNVKFEYERDNNNATLKINTFTVTDGKGYQFIFNDFDAEKRKDELIFTNIYKSAYFLSRILSPTGKLLATFTYDKKSKSIPSTGELLYQYCKLKMIETDLGKVILDYQFDESLAETPNDLYSLQKITLKNSLDQIINSFTFNYIISSFPYKVKERKRLLVSINKNDKNDQKIEQTSFVYNQTFTERPSFSEYGNNLCFPNEIIVQDSYYYNNYKFGNILEKIISPSGGVTHYEYGYHEYFEDHNTPEYHDLLLSNFFNPDIQNVVSETKQFDSSQSDNFTFTIAGDPNTTVAFKLKFSIQGYHEIYDDTPPIESPDPLNPYPKPKPFYTNFKIKNSSGEIINGFSCISGTESNFRTYKGNPGTYTIQVSGTGKGYGTYLIDQMTLLPPPYKNIKKTLLTGPRLKSIKTYTGLNETTPVKALTYAYDLLDGTGSSGSIFNSESDKGNSANEPYIMYKNVKVSEAGNGYTRFTHITLNDYPKYQDGGTSLYPTYYYPFYNITKGGLISKKEIYNEQNQLLSSEDYTYDFDNYSNEPYQFYISNPYASKPAYVKKITSIDKNYTKNGGLIEHKKESLFNVSNLSPSLIKETTSGGDITESQLVYPTEISGYTHLQNAHMVSDPVQTIQKKNGKIISTIQTKFDNNKLQPTSVIAINPNDNSIKTALKYDDYDQKGNLRQYTAIVNETTGQGISTVMIWGYHETLPIAKIEGATLADIGALADDIILKSNADVDPSSETALINALDAFRSLPALRNAVITTYTYDPLIGVTTVTPPNGMRVIYKYDLNNRLKAVVDVNGNISEDYQYNTKPQP